MPSREVKTTEVKQMRDLALTGMSITEIGRRVNRTTACVRKYAGDLIPKHPNLSRFRREHGERIRKLALQGKSTTYIAWEVGCSEVTVRRYAKDIRAARESQRRAA